MTSADTTKENTVERPPVVVVLGHVDHGKSTLLDYIRKTNTVDTEAGGITQHVAAYEVEHADEKGAQKRITFLDTPGHEAFQAMRSRSTHIADIAILIVSAEDGVREQTKESLETIRKQNIPFVVAINKIDKPAANLEKTIGSLAEHEVYLEGRGGTVPYTAISAKTGQGVDELLELILLVAELEELKGNEHVLAEGFVIESHRDPKKGVSATLLIKNGVLESGMYVAAGTSTTPTRILEDFAGTSIAVARFSSPIKIVGWSSPPIVGTTFKTFQKKKDAEAYAQAQTKQKSNATASAPSDEEGIIYVPIVIKADVVGSVDAIEYELSKIDIEHFDIRVVRADVGSISEGDIKAAGGDTRTIILGFHTSVDNGVHDLATREGITIQTFDIIYKLTEWLTEELERRRPEQEETKIQGITTILRTFSETKKAQVVGGRVESGRIAVGDHVNILRRGEKIGDGTIKELQSQKSVAKHIAEGDECGIKVATTISIAQKDELESTPA